MKVFISWSGDLSKQLAEILRQWLPSVIQAVKPYYTPDDITKGARWTTEIAKELEESSIGILCLTSDNLEAPWIMFEAGALSKKMDKSKVCPILFGIEPTDIKGPLVQFQSTKFEKEEIKKLVRMINGELSEKGLSPNVIDEVFDMWWPKLKDKVDAQMKIPHKSTKGSKRSERELLEEILELSRGTALLTERSSSIKGIHPGAVSDLVESLRHISMSIRRYPPTPRLMKAFEELKHPVEYIIREAEVTRSQKRELTAAFDEAISPFRVRRQHQSDEPETEEPAIDTSSEDIK